MVQRRLTIGALVVGALCVLGTVVFGEGRKAPDFRLKAMEGDDVQFVDNLHRGPILVDFWATWCIPCLNEMVELQKLYERYHERGFEIFGVSIDNPRTASKVKPTVKSKGFTFPILLDPDKEVLKKFGGKNVVPYAVLVSPDGEVIAIYEGYKAGNEKAVEEAIQPYLIDVEPDSSSTEGETD